MEPDGPGGGRRARSVTLEDVARRVGVSARTVSRVINDEGGCTPETRDRILTAIDELGYRPNLMARALIRRRSDTVGLITAEIKDPFFPEVADGIQRAAEELGRTMFLANSSNDRQRQLRALTSMHGRGVDGVIVFPALHSHEDLAAIASDGLPIVVINDEFSAPGILTVAADIRAGAVKATNHLIERGRTRIALVIDRNARNASRPSRRERGYREALDMAGLGYDDALVVEVDNSIEGGRQGARHLLSHRTRPDAVFAYNDQMAVGVLQEMLSAGIFVPEDIAIIGFDDITLCTAVTPMLSSIRIDRDQLGRLAVEAIQDLLENPAASTAPRVLEVELVQRETT